MLNRDAVKDDFDGFTEGLLSNRMKTEVEQLREENQRLKSAVLHHWQQKADDRCIDDDTELYKAFGLEPADHRVGDRFEMLKNCMRFVENRCQGGHWSTYVELESKIRDLETWKSCADRQVDSQALQLRDLREKLSTQQHLFGGAEVKIALLERDNEQLRHQVIHHVERIGGQSEIVTKLTEGAKARNKRMEELTEFLFEAIGDGQTRECKLEEDGWCAEHGSNNPCLVWRIKQMLKE